MELRVHRIPWSTNVERIALAAAHKSVPVTYVDHDPEDRSSLRTLSGQELVPVAEFPGGEILADSPRILRRLEELVPEPPLWPHDPGRRAEADIFVEWFNRVWKVPPNAIDAERRRAEPDTDRIRLWAEELRGWLPLFESLLTGRPFLLGDTLGIADVVTFPFLRYGLLHDPADEDPFHHVLVEEMPITPDYPLLTEWVQRLDQLPRA
ncbi:glutathione S-transferase family protein [Paraconexibacter sp.]|uniref:glutathione S-transferase family protein n=1 Tax=Paraconexibacter sp. TaxID=2949640 RepID=UPI00356267F8